MVIRYLRIYTFKPVRKTRLCCAIDAGLGKTPKRDKELEYTNSVPYRGFTKACQSV